MPIIALVHVKKTAGQTIKHLLRRELGVTHCDVKRWRHNAPFFDADDLHRLLWVYPRLRSIAGHSIKPYSDLETAFPDIRYYTFLRDPIRRAVSQFQHRTHLGTIDMPFEDWIRDPKYHDWQVSSLAGVPDLDRALHMLDKMSFVGLQERFHESLLLMQRALGLADVDLSPVRVNAAKDNSIRDEILSNERNLELLHEANRLDLELYRHAREVIYPRQQAALSPGHPPAAAAPSASRTVRRYSRRYCSNVAYRTLVYKPIVWMYRTGTPKHPSGAGRSP